MKTHDSDSKSRIPAVKNPPPPPSRSKINREIAYIVLTGGLLSTCPPLAGLMSLMYNDDNRKRNVYDKYGMYMNTFLVASLVSAVAIAIAITFNTETTLKKQMSPVSYAIFKTVWFLSSIIAPVSLLIVLIASLNE